jgi:DNA-directed RNA polymerase specialized sigma24 family protein
MSASDRVDKLLALLLLNSLKGAAQQDKIIQLSLAGFSNIEIADLLQTTSGVVAQTLYAARRAGPRRSQTPKRSTKKAR